MGKTLLGGTTREKDISLLTPQQRKYLGQAGEGYSQFLQPSPEDLQERFQTSIVDPTMLQFERQILPAIQQRFVDVNAGSSSALNQALSQSATDLGTMLGGQYQDFYNQETANVFQALQGLGGLGSQQTFQPTVSQSQGILGPILQGLSTIASAYVGAPTPIPGAGAGGAPGGQFAGGQGFGRGPF